MRPARTLLVIALVLIGSTIAGQDTHVVPDYSSWKKLGKDFIGVTIDGVKTQIIAEAYEKTVEPDNHALFLFYNEKDLPWLIIYNHIVFTKDSAGKLSLQSHKVYLFENRNNAWVFIEEFDGEDFNGPRETLRSNYKLEFK